MSNVPALVVEGLGHRFGARRVLKDVSFSIAPGDFTVLLGLNGAGKTTLFSLATRLYAQAEGTIRIFGMDIREQMLECLRQMGIVFQQPTSISTSRSSRTCFTTAPCTALLIAKPLGGWLQKSTVSVSPISARKRRGG